ERRRREMAQIGTAAGIVAAMTAATLLSRFLPFIIFRGDRKTPPFVEFLGRTLPYATIGLLVIYCLRAAPVATSRRSRQGGGGGASDWGVPELAAVAVVALLHRWKKNALLCIGLGTVFSLASKQEVFA